MCEREGEREYVLCVSCMVKDVVIGGNVVVHPYQSLKHSISSA